MYTPATLHALRLHLGLDPADSADEVRLSQALRAASAHIERLTGRRFSPRRETIAHRAGPDRTTLLLRADLLTLVALTDAVSGQVIDLDRIECLPEGDGPCLACGAGMLAGRKRGRPAAMRFRMTRWRRRRSRSRCRTPTAPMSAARVRVFRPVSWCVWGMNTCVCWRSMRRRTPSRWRAAHTARLPP